MKTTFILFAILALLTLNACAGPITSETILEESVELEGLSVIFISEHTGWGAERDHQANLEKLNLVLEDKSIEVVRLNTIYSSYGFLRAAEVFYRKR